MGAASINDVAARGLRAAFLLVVKACARSSGPSAKSTERVGSYG